MYRTHIDDLYNYTPASCTSKPASCLTLQSLKDTGMPDYSGTFEALLNSEKTFDGLQSTIDTHDLAYVGQEFTQVHIDNASMTLESLLYTGDVLFPSTQQTQHLQDGCLGYVHHQHSSIHSTAPVASKASSAAATTASISSSMLSPQNSIFNVSTAGSLSPLSIESDYFNHSTPSTYQQNSQYNISVPSSGGLDTTTFIASLSTGLCDLNPPTATSAIACSSVPDTSLPFTLPASFLFHTTASCTDYDISAAALANNKPEPHHRRLSISSTSCSADSLSTLPSFLSNNKEGEPHSEAASSSSADADANGHKPTRHNNMYHCEYKGCTKTFTRTYNLKSHRRTHTDEKPFVCDVCSKAFARQHDRNRHAKLHLRIKPYPCQFCSKSFARQDALNRHLKRDKKMMKKNKGGIHSGSSRIRNGNKEEDPASVEGKDRSDQNDDHNDDDNGSVDLIDIYPPPCLMMKMRQRQAALRKKKQQQQRQLEKQQRQQR